MASPITRIVGDELFATLRRLGEAKATTDHADWMRSPGNAEWLIQAVDEKRGLLEPNPFMVSSVDGMLRRLSEANSQEGWGIGDEVFERLRKTAPPWPRGRNAFCSFRIRFGVGDEGVKRTFEAHMTQIKRVFGKEGVWRWRLLYSGKVPYGGKDVERLRLLNGNGTHKPCVEWVTTNLEANRQRESIAAVRGPKSLADEGLVLAWMFKDRVRAADFDKFPAWYLAGYQSNAPEENAGDWQHVPYVDFRQDSRQAGIGARSQDDDRASYSVPYFEPCSEPA